MLRNSDRIRKELENRLADAELEMRLWESVEICRKKDGTDFKNRKQSFKNATWYDNGAYNISAYCPEITVTGCHKGGCGGWKTYTLYMYEYVDEMSADDPRREKANPKESYIRQTYTLSVDEAYNRIRARVIQLSERAQSLRKSLDSLERIYNKFFDEIESAMQSLKVACFDFRSDDNFPSSIEYEMIEELQKMSAGSLLR